MNIKRMRFSLLAFTLMSAGAFSGSYVDVSIEDRETVEILQPRMDYNIGDTEGGVYEVASYPGGKSLIAYIEQYNVGTVSLGQQEFSRVMLPNATSDAKVGAPHVEAYRKLVTIPDNVDLEIIIDDSRTFWADTHTNIRLSPQQEFLPDVVIENGNGRPDMNMPFVINNQAYQRVDKVKPLIEIESIVKARDKRIAVIKFNPMQYNPVTKELKVASQIHFELKFIKKPHRTESETGRVETPPVDNNQPVVVTQRNADYLIITPPQYTQTLEPFVEWKKKLGYKVFVATTDQTGSNYDSIKRYLSNAYRAENATEYVLLIGDNDQIPGKLVLGHPFHNREERDRIHRWYTDFDYVLLNGTDAFPDVALGRMPVDTVEQLEMLLQRSIDYQSNPPRNGRFDHVLMAGQFQDLKDNSDKFDDIAARMFMEDLHRASDFLGPDYDFFSDTPREPDPYNKGFTVHTALDWERNILLPTGGFRPLKYGGWDYGNGRVTPPEFIPRVWLQQGEGTHLNITRAIENGVGLVMHRDHGYNSGAGWAHPDFRTGNVERLNNQTYPVVLSLNCATGRMDDRDAFAESWVLNADKGAVAFIGAARVSYSGSNDLFHVGLLDTFWDDYDENWSSDVYELSWRPAEALNRAKVRVYAQYGTGDDSRGLLTARLFNFLGDPEIELRTQPPFEFDANYVQRVERGTRRTYSVRVGSNLGPAVGARVTMMLADNNFDTQITNANGQVWFDIVPDQNFSFLINKHNAVPYVADIEVFERPVPPPIVRPPVVQPPPPVVQPPVVQPPVVQPPVVQPPVVQPPVVQPPIVRPPVVRPPVVRPPVVRPPVVRPPVVRPPVVRPPVVRPPVVRPPVVRPPVVRPPVVQPPVVQPPVVQPPVVQPPVVQPPVAQPPVIQPPSGSGGAFSFGGSLLLLVLAFFRRK